MGENWTDLPLVADNDLRVYLNRRAYNTSSGTIDRYYEAIVLNDAHLRMWNIEVNENDLEKRLAYLKGDTSHMEMGDNVSGDNVTNREAFRVDEKMIGRIAPELDSRTLYRSINDILSDAEKTTRDRVESSTCYGETGIRDNDCEITSSRNEVDNDTTTMMRNVREGTKIKRFVRAINNTNDFGASFIDASGRSVAERRDRRNLASESDRFIRIMRSRDVRDVLRIYPNVRLLMLDQYTMFTDVRFRTFQNLHYIFTGAPTSDETILPNKNDNLFWNRMRELNGKTEFSGIKCDDENSPFALLPSRQCNRIWLHYVPNVDFILRTNPKADVRVVDIHLDDNNDTLIWRNLMATFLDNEKIGLRVLRKDLDDERRDRESEETLERFREVKRNMKLLINLRYEGPESAAIGETFEEKRWWWDDERNDGNVLTYAKLRLKRFAAFFMKVDSQRKKMIFGPTIYWTMTNQRYLNEIYQSIFEETIKGYVNGIPRYDRFLDITVLHPLRLSEKNTYDFEWSLVSSERVKSNEETSMMLCSKELSDFVDKFDATKENSRKDILEKLVEFERRRDRGEEEVKSDNGEYDEDKRREMVIEEKKRQFLSEKIKDIKMNRIVLGSCRMKDGTKEQRSSDNVLGVIYNALFSRATYDATTYRLINLWPNQDQRDGDSRSEVISNGRNANVVDNEESKRRGNNNDNFRVKRGNDNGTRASSGRTTYRDMTGNSTYISRHASGAPVYKLTNCEW